MVVHLRRPFCRPGGRGLSGSPLLTIGKGPSGCSSKETIRRMVSFAWCRRNTRQQMNKQHHLMLTQPVPPGCPSTRCPSCSPASTVWGSSAVWGWAATRSVSGAVTPAPAESSPDSTASAAAEPGGPSSAPGNPAVAEPSGAPPAARK